MSAGEDLAASLGRHFGADLVPRHELDEVRAQLAMEERQHQAEAERLRAQHKKAVEALEQIVAVKWPTGDWGREQQASWDAASKVTRIAREALAPSPPEGPERCPTCGSDEPGLTGRGGETHIKPCPDPFHSPEGQGRCPTCGLRREQGKADLFHREACPDPFHSPEGQE